MDASDPTTVDGKTPLTALVVEPSGADSAELVSALAADAYRVTVAHSFRDARRLLESHPPALLITALRLGEYNGLHLVLRAQSMAPRIAAMVISTVDDPVLRVDAERIGATFAARPLDIRELRAAVQRTLWRRDTDSRDPIRPPFERRLAQVPAAVLPHEDRRRSAPHDATAG